MCDGNTLFKKKLRVDLMDSPKRPQKKRKPPSIFSLEKKETFLTLTFEKNEFYCLLLLLLLLVQ